MTHSVRMPRTLIYGHSFFGNAASSMMKISMPYIIYIESGSAIYTASQFAIALISTYIATAIVSYLSLRISDKYYIAISECTTGLCIISLYIFVEDGFIFVFCITIVESFLSTIKSSYTESLIGFLCKNVQVNRQSIIGQIKSLSNIGSMIGLYISIPLLASTSKNVFFATVSFLYIISTLLIIIAPLKLEHKYNGAPRKTSISILLTSRFKNLTISHFLMSISLNIFNCTTIVAILGHFQGTEANLTTFYLLSSVGAIAGSLLLSITTSKSGISFSKAPAFRFIYFSLFFASIFADSVYAYMIIFSAFNLLHSFCIGLWQDMFQEISSENEWKIVGATRKMLVSIAGVIGAIMGGGLFTSFGYQYTYIMSTIISLFSLLYIYLHCSEKRLTVISN